jgi:hypothetical protein
MLQATPTEGQTAFTVQRKVSLMKTSPWFSTEAKESPNDEEVHHNNTTCMDGDNIGKNFRRYGTDNRPLCKQCERLDAAGR